MPKCLYYPVSVLSVLIWTPRGHAKVFVLSSVRIKCVNMDTRGHAEVSVLSGVRIKRVNFRENIRAFYSSGQTELSVISRCPY